MKQNNIAMSLSTALDSSSLRWVALLGATVLWYLITSTLMFDPASYAFIMMPLLAIFLLFCLGVSYAGMLRLQRSHQQIWLRLCGFLLVCMVLCGGMPWAGMGFTAFGSWLAMRYFSKAHPQKIDREGSHIKEDVTRVAVEFEKTRKSNDRGVLLGGARIPLNSLTKHLLFIGTTGSGKSVSIKLIMKDVLPGIGSGIDRRAIVYDAPNEAPAMFEEWGFPSYAIIHTNPLDQRCRPWAMCQDIKTTTQIIALAEILITVPAKANEPFWVEVTQICIVAVVRYFNAVAPGVWTFRDLLIAVRSQEMIIKMCEDDNRLQHYAQVFGSDKTATNIMSSVITNTQKYEIIAALWHRAETVYGNQPFSLQEWVSSSSILILSRSNTAERELREVNRIMFTHVTNLLMEIPEVNEPTTHIFLDEMGSLGKLESLRKMTTELRKRGVGVVAGFQSISDIVENFNENMSNTILSQFNHVAALRLSDAKTEQAIREITGRVRFERITETVSKSYANGKSKTFTQTFVEEDVLRHGELNDIPEFDPSLGTPLTGFYRSGHRKWMHSYPAEIVQQLPPKGDPSRNLIMMPEEYQELVPWTLDDWQRLDILHLQEDSFDALPADDMTITQLLDEPPEALPEGYTEGFSLESDEKEDA